MSNAIQCIHGTKLTMFASGNSIFLRVKPAIVIELPYFEILQLGADLLVTPLHLDLLLRQSLTLEIAVLSLNSQLLHTGPQLLDCVVLKE